MIARLEERLTGWIAEMDGQFKEHNAASSWIWHQLYHVRSSLNIATGMDIGDHVNDIRRPTILPLTTGDHDKWCEIHCEAEARDMASAGAAISQAAVPQAAITEAAVAQAAVTEAAVPQAAVTEAAKTGAGIPTAEANKDTRSDGDEDEDVGADVMVPSAEVEEGPLAMEVDPIVNNQSMPATDVPLPPVNLISATPQNSQEATMPSITQLQPTPPNPQLGSATLASPPPPHAPTCRGSTAAPSPSASAALAQATPGTPQSISVTPRSSPAPRQARSIRGTPVPPPVRGSSRMARPVPTPVGGSSSTGLAVPQLQGPETRSRSRSRSQSRGVSPGDKRQHQDSDGENNGTKRHKV